MRRIRIQISPSAFGWDFPCQRRCHDGSLRGFDSRPRLSFHVVDAGEVFGGISDLQELEVGPHAIQLYREIFRLHLDFENLPLIGDCLAPAERQQRDSLFGIISRSKERKALDVVPMKVCERDTDLFLLVADGAKVSAQISQ